MTKKYTQAHEWLEMTPNETVRIGITHYAQEQLGDIIFIELPELGKKLTKGDEMAVIESVKAASEVYAPVSGEIVAVNEQLRTQPEYINAQAETQGWIAELKPDDAASVQELMNKEEYEKIIENH